MLLKNQKERRNLQYKETVSEENVCEANFPYLVKYINIQIQEAKQTTNSINKKIHTQAQYNQISVN